MKKLFFIFLSCIIIGTIIIFAFRDRFSIESIISNIESQTGLDIQLNDDSTYAFYPSINFNNENVAISKKNIKLIIKKSKINVSKSYWPTSSINLNLTTSAINYQGIEIRNAFIDASYQKNILTINSFIGNIIEGNRPLVLEIQSLVSTANYGTPQRSCNGYNIKRFNMILAVLEKRVGLKVNSQDVFINVAGGLKIDDPGGDLPLSMAIISSYEEKPIDNKICFAGEIGLNGEIRSISRIEARIIEAEKLGFKEIIISKYNKIDKKSKERKITVSLFKRVQEVYEYVFNQN